MMDEPETEGDEITSGVAADMSRAVDIEIQRPALPVRLESMCLGDLDGRATISVEEAGSLLGLGRTAAYEAIRRGQLPSRRLGRRLVVPVPALLDWLGVTVSPSGDDGDGRLPAVREERW